MNADYNEIHMISQDTPNPLLANLRVIDGITVTLPSRGLMYPEGVLSEDVVDGELRVYPMTTRDEILLRSADGIFGGTSIDRVFSRCIPQVLKPRDLFFNDIDYLMVALRQVSYGEDLQIEYTHDCENAKEHSYIVKVDKILSKSVQLDPLRVEEMFTLVLPTNQVVKLRPIRLIDMMSILQPPTTEELTPEQSEREVLKMYMAQIESVDGISDPNLIYEWVGELPTNCIKLLRQKISKMDVWGIDYTNEITCRDCSEKLSITTPLNPVSFFS